MRDDDVHRVRGALVELGGVVHDDRDLAAVRTLFRERRDVVERREHGDVEGEGSGDEALQPVEDFRNMRVSTQSFLHALLHGTVRLA